MFVAINGKHFIVCHVTLIWSRKKPLNLTGAEWGGCMIIDTIPPREKSIIDQTGNDKEKALTKSEW